MIGYYVHHQGRGHLHRALAIASALGEPVTGLSSLERPDGWQGEWLVLERDDAGSERVNLDAGGILHWVPLRDAGLAARMASISAWIARVRPSAVVVDVSVEVVLLCRLHGVPVVTVAMPGDRTDTPHALGVAASSALIGAWPAGAEGIVAVPPSARPKLTAVGGISRFAGRTVRPSQGASRRVLVLLGRGGVALDPVLLQAAQNETPEWHWDVIGGDSGRWADDPWDLILDASVVITHVGQNSVADVAAARRPAILLPQDRPHGEQRATASLLAGGDWPVTVLEQFPSHGWADLLEETARLDGLLWREWVDGGGAARAAAVIREVAEGAP